MAQDQVRVPTFDQLMNPTIRAMRDLGGSGSIEEIYEKVIKNLNLPDELLEIPHGNKPGAQTEVAYRLAWTRTYLKKYGILENSSRGVWSLTPAAKNINAIDTSEVVRKVREMPKKNRSAEEASVDREIGAAPEMEEPDEIQDCKDELLSVLISMTPDAFERLT